MKWLFKDRYSLFDIAVITFAVTSVDKHGLLASAAILVVGAAITALLETLTCK